MSVDSFCRGCTSTDVESTIDAIDPEQFSEEDGPDSRRLSENDQFSVSLDENLFQKLLTGAGDHTAADSTEAPAVQEGAGSAPSKGTPETTVEESAPSKGTAMMPDDFRAVMPEDELEAPAIPVLGSLPQMGVFHPQIQPLVAVPSHDMGPDVGGALGPVPEHPIIVRNETGFDLSVRLDMDFPSEAMLDILWR